MHYRAFVVGLIVAGCGALAEEPRRTDAISIIVVGGPKEGVLVAFHDADGNVLSTERTGPDGKAMSPRKSPAVQVSALLGYAEYHRVVTWVGVELGDELRVENVPPDAPCTFEGSYRLQVSDFPGATGYAARTDGGGYPVETVTSYWECWHETNVVVVAASNEERLAFAFAKGVPPPTRDDEPLALGPWMAPARIPVDAKNVTPNMDVRTFVQELLGGRRLGGTHIGLAKTPAGLNEYLVAPGLADRYEVSATEATEASYAAVGSRSVTKFVTKPEPVVLDFADALPPITEATMDLSDPARPAFSWHSAAPLAGSDGGLVSFRWGSGGGSGGPTPDSGDWQIVVPPTAVRVKAPILPAEAAAWLPLAGTTQAGMVYFATVDGDRGYRAFREDVTRATTRDTVRRTEH